jgi:hypothetical protein
MAKGKCWPKEDANSWAERWWRSGLTSAEFVEMHQLPISSRTLRAHAERHLGEVLDEVDAFRRQAFVGEHARPAVVRAPCHSAPLAQVSVTAPPIPAVTPCQVVVRAPAFVPVPHGACFQHEEPRQMAPEGRPGRRAPKEPFDFSFMPDEEADEPSPDVHVNLFGSST